MPVQKRPNSEVLVFVDSDCILSESWLSTALELLESEQASMVGSKTHTLPEDATWVEKTWKVHLDRTCNDSDATWIVTRALAVERDKYDEIGGFDETLETCEDVALGHAIGSIGKIVSSSELAPLHLKDARTLGEMYKKELWRGKNSLKTSRKELNQSKELLSFTLPFYYTAVICSLILSCAATLVGFWYPLFFSAAAFAIPIIGIALNTCFKTKEYDYFFKLITVYTVYILARVRATFS